MDELQKLQNGYLTTYAEQTATLAKTVVIKFTEAATLINEGLVARYGNEVVDPFRPETWKYYLNLAGQYHPTDTMMSVVSIDTLETIDFTVENLRIHTATAAAHAYGTRNYNALLYKYPTQEALINGILNPADLDIAIEAESGSVVAYPKNLVEPNEVSLMVDFEALIKRTMARWYNVQFAMSDDLYCAAFFNNLSTFFQVWLLNLRMARAKTAEAHSFHIRMYLASHGGLDVFLPYMTQKQALWFYRNICYLERNPGTSKQFVTLVQKLLTDRNIPIGEYSLRQLDNFTNYLPEAKARLKLINPGTNSSGVELHTLPTVYAKEVPLAEGNADYLAAHEAHDTFTIQTANSAATQTKLLDSSMVDYSNAIPEPFESVALRQWCYMANKGLYDVVISFKDPKTSEDRSLFAKDAFLYMYYVALSMDGLTQFEIPKYLNLRQRRQPKPTLADLLSVVPWKEYSLKDLAQTILQRQPQIQACYSVSAFYEHVQTLTDEAYWHWFLTASQGDMYLRALVENMINRLYTNELYAIDVGTPHYGPWLHANNLPVYNFDRTEAAQLLKNIYEAGTGQVVDNTRLLKNIQKAMLDMMTKLSSYSIQIAREINEDDIILLNWPAIRLGNVRQSQQSHCLVDAPIRVTDSNSQTGVTAEIPVSVMANNAVSEHICHLTVEVEAVPEVTSGIQPNVWVNDPISPIRTDVTYEGQDKELDDSMGLPGYTTFARLPEAVKRSLKSRY